MNNDLLNPTQPIQPQAGKVPPNKVLVIGLDGATFDLIKPWAAEGRLPTLRRLLEKGAHGSLRSTIPPMTGPALRAGSAATILALWVTAYPVYRRTAA